MAPPKKANSGKLTPLPKPVPIPKPPFTLPKSNSVISQSRPKPKRKWKFAKSQIEAMPRIATHEAHWFKNPGEELREAMLWRLPDKVMPDYSKSGKMTVHTHPQFRRPSMPSIQDLVSFANLGSRAQTIGSITYEGALAGYTLITKKKGFASRRLQEMGLLMGSKEKAICDIEKMRIDNLRTELASLAKLPMTKENEIKIEVLRGKWRKSGEAYTEAIQSVLKKLGWKIRMRPMEGFEFRWGYYIKKPPGPKAGSTVLVSTSEKNKAEEERKRADAERRRRISGQQRERQRIRIRN